MPLRKPTVARIEQPKRTNVYGQRRIQQCERLHADERHCCGAHGANGAGEWLRCGRGNSCPAVAEGATKAYAAMMVAGAGVG
jgi:hypothetical protein